MNYDHSSGGPRPRTSGATPGQGDLFAQAPEPERDLTTPERFEEFHAENPAFYAALVQLARRFRDATGRTEVGIQRLVEIARWDMQIATQGAEEFKVNNNFGAYYSRLIMLQERDLAGMFHIRAAEEPDRWIAMVKHGLTGGRA